VISDILQSTGLFPDPRSTVPWLAGTRLPISLGTSTLSKYIIYNFLSATRERVGSCDHWLLANYDRLKRFFDQIWDKTQKSKTAKAPDGLEAGGIIWISGAKNTTSDRREEISWEIYTGTVEEGGMGMGDAFDKWQFAKKQALTRSNLAADWSFLVVHTHPDNVPGSSGPGDSSKAVYSPEATVTATEIVVYKGYYVRGDRQAKSTPICRINR